MMDRKTRVRFDRVRRAAANLRGRVEESAMNDSEGMKKYGYEKKDEKEDPNTKTATDRSVCPKCGSPLSGQPPVCPKCGSEPFEKKTEGKKG